MNIVVCVKLVPDTETRIVLNKAAKAIEKTGVNFVLNPYDEFAVEEALRLREKFGGTVTAITAGPAQYEQALRSALAMGADNAVHILDDSYERADAYAVAKALAKAIATIPCDLVLCGRQAIDDDSGQVGAILAESLNLPQVTVINKLEVAADQKSAVAQRDIEGATEVWEVALPAVLTAQKGLNEPRYPSLMGIKKAARKEITVLTPAGLGVDPAETGAAGSLLEVLDINLPPARQAGKIVPGEAADAARELCRLLREEAKVV